MTRTLHLRERSRHLLKLPPAEVAFLAALPRRWLRVEPIGRRVLLTLHGIAGVIEGPSLRLEIAPKVPLSSLLLLMGDDPPSTSAQETGESPSLLDAVVACFLGHLRQRIAMGLQRGYREQAHVAPILSGRLDVPAQIRQGPTRPEMLHQIVDAYTPDIPANRLLRSALEALRTTPGLSLSARQELDRATISLIEVAPLPESEWTLPLNAPPEYGPVIDAARLVLAGLASQNGHFPGVGFVLELERLFEAWLIRQLVTATPCGTVIEPQARRVLRGRTGPALVIRPDALVRREGKPVRVIDAKWKRLRRGRPGRADVYQMLAYAEILAVPEVVLVYPGRRTQEREFPPTPGGTRLRFWTVRPEDGATLARRLLG